MRNLYSLVNCTLVLTVWICLVVTAVAASLCKFVRLLYAKGPRNVVDTILIY